jgi:DNA-binding response OmpR family regulator
MAEGIASCAALEEFASNINTSGKAPTCIVVEDSSSMRNLITNYLEAHDVRAIPASCRDEAVNLLARCQPDLIVLDLRLGQEDGLDLLR